MWRDVELRELRIFLVLADELHFGRTAERIGISQPGVSEAVRVLESRLGVKLFDRTSRRVRLTPAGEELRRRLAPALSALKQALAETSDLSGDIRGLLRIGFVLTTEGPALSGLVAAFHDRYPACEVRSRRSRPSTPTGHYVRAISTSCATGWRSTNPTSPRAPCSPATTGRSP